MSLFFGVPLQDVRVHLNDHFHLHKSQFETDKMLTKTKRFSYLSVILFVGCILSRFDVILYMHTILIRDKPKVIE